MSKLRVYELARELNIETKVLLSKLKGAGAKVLSHQSTLTEQQVQELRGAFGAKGGGGQAAAAPSVAADAGKPKVVIRRRAATRPEEAAAEAPEPVVAAEAPAPTPTTAVVSEPPSHAEVEEDVEAAPYQPAATPPPAPAAAATVVRREAASATVTRPAQASGAVRQAAEPAAKKTEDTHLAEAHAVVTEAPPAVPAAAMARQSHAAAQVEADVDSESTDVLRARRREVAGGATIVRRATPEEVEKLENQNRQRHTGRKEDHRGTRVTGLGLLSNRVTANVDASGAPVAPPPQEESWSTERRGATAVKDRKTAEEEELARKKAAAKARRAHTALTTRALLQQADEILTPEAVDDEVLPQPVAAPRPDYQARTVYTPNALRSKRDLKRRKDLKKTQITTPRATKRVVDMSESITVGELARQLAVKAPEIIKKLMSQGVMATINQSIDFDTATLLASEYHYEVKSNVKTAEDILKGQVHGTTGEVMPRPAIVTVMGHVDHGKTSILDAIRTTDVAGGEAGGITQHIGAYSVEHDGQKITFLDTPGHEAFSSMRARGAKVTDIVVLVVAADDGVMPQTIEAISHARDAGVPLIVAINKIDKPNINLDRVYTELTEHGVQAEEWGGETQFIKCSAIQRQGINELLEAILLQAEVLDLSVPEQGMAEGVVIEAHLDKGRGPVATIVVQQGTLRPGEYIVAGTECGRVRAMSDYRGREVTAALPSDPVEIIGLSGVPRAGDLVNVVVDEKTARDVAEWRLDQIKKAAGAKSSAQSLADLLAKVQTADVPEVPVILKGDTQGSVEAISESILKLNTEKVKNRLVHAAVGGVTESDITLAQASGAIIVAFNVRAARGLDELADKNGVMIRYFSIIYDIVDTMKSIMVGRLPPVVSEVVLGHAEVRKPISVPKIGTIAGSAVLDGKITRASLCRLIRDDIVIYVGKLGSLRRFKDDVKEVMQGYECGVGIEGYNDLKEGDVIEAYVLEETAATL